MSQFFSHVDVVLSNYFADNPRSCVIRFCRVLSLLSVIFWFPDPLITTACPLWHPHGIWPYQDHLDTSWCSWKQINKSMWTLVFDSGGIIFSSWKRSILWLDYKVNLLKRLRLPVSFNFLIKKVILILVLSTGCFLTLSKYNLHPQWGSEYRACSVIQLKKTKWLNLVWFEVSMVILWVNLSF